MQLMLLTVALGLRAEEADSLLVAEVSQAQLLVPVLRRRLDG